MCDSYSVFSLQVIYPDIHLIVVTFLAMSRVESSRWRRQDLSYRGLLTTSSVTVRPSLHRARCDSGAICQRPGDSCSGMSPRSALGFVSLRSLAGARQRRERRRTLDLLIHKSCLDSIVRGQSRTAEWQCLEDASLGRGQSESMCRDVWIRVAT